MVVALSDNLKGLKDSVKEADEQTKNALATLGNTICLVEEGQELLEARLLDRLTDRFPEESFKV